MTNPDARPEPIYVAEHEGEYVRVMQAALPSISLPMDAGYRRNTHIKVEMELRVRNIRYDELTAKEQKETGEVGGMKRVHVFVIEEARILDAMTAEQADEGVGGSAGGGQLRVEERFELEGMTRECWYDPVACEVVHRGQCAICLSQAGDDDEVLSFPPALVEATSDPGF